MRPLAFWSALIALTVLSLMPTGMLPPQAFSLWDKAQHALGFAALCLLALWAYPRLAQYTPWALLAHGGLIELVQGATGWRRADGLDWLADAVGIALASLWWHWRKRLQTTS